MLGYCGTAVLGYWSVGVLEHWGVGVFECLCGRSLFPETGYTLMAGIAKKSFDHNVRKIELDFRRRKSSTLKAQT